MDLVLIAVILWAVQIFMDMVLFIPASCGFYNKKDKVFNVRWFIANVIFNLCIVAFNVTVWVKT